MGISSSSVPEGESAPPDAGSGSRGSKNQPKSYERAQHAHQALTAAGGSSGGATNTSTADDVVPTVFKWDHGGRNVYITGTFNNWERQLPMHKSGNDFSLIFNLKRGQHAYKFIVDDEWRFAPDQPTVADAEGRINNYIDVSNFAAYTGDQQFFSKSKERKIPLEDYAQHIPELDEYTKEPPALPPHLRHIILNKPNPQADPLSLPVPQHVALNHLYCTAIKDNIMVLGATQRYREKFVTVVFYAVMPAATSPVPQRGSGGSGSSQHHHHHHHQQQQHHHQQQQHHHQQQQQQQQALPVPPR